MRRQSFDIPGHVHFLTFSCYRRCQILTDESACRLLAGSLSAAREKLDFELWSYVFMPDHVHILLRPRNVGYSMAELLKSVKGPFAKWLVDLWRKEHPERLRRLTVESASGPVIRVWQRGGGFDRNLHTEELIRRAVDYIEWNPVRKGLVRDPLGWRWSSARARAGLGDIPITLDAISWFQNSKELDLSRGVSV